MQAMNYWWAIVLTVALPLSTLASEPCACDVGELVAPDELFPQVKLTTSMGDIIVELDRRRAPITVNNFLRYVTDGRYNDTVFHRIMADFVVQGGGYKTSNLESVTSYGNIYNESGNGLQNTLGTIAMARYSDPHTASSQFFFNLKDNESLNPSPRRWGYTVFGQIVEGQNVLTQLATVETGFSSQLSAENVPLEPVILRKVELVSAQQ